MINNTLNHYVAHSATGSKIHLSASNKDEAKKKIKEELPGFDLVQLELLPNPLPIDDWRSNPFQPGELIEYCDDIYEVVTNYGSSGIVRFPDDEGKFSDKSGTTELRWYVFGVDCTRVFKTKLS
jgi:hypothetical protein